MGARLPDNRRPSRDALTFLPQSTAYESFGVEYSVRIDARGAQGRKEACGKRDSREDQGHANEGGYIRRDTPYIKPAIR